MIQIQSILKVADNSGAKTVKCIKILNKSKQAHIGDYILVSVQTVKSGLQNTTNFSTKRSSSIKKGQIFKALIIRTKKPISNRPHGHTLSFQSNDVVLLSSGPISNAKLIGSRIFGPVTRELRLKNYTNIISQAKRIL